MPAIFTEAFLKHACPKCGAEPTKHCRQPKGRRQWPPHNERVALVDPAVGKISIKKDLFA